MTTQNDIEALVIVTPQQLDTITALIGADKVHRCIVPENNIAAFWSEGPQIMAQIANALPDSEQLQLKDWADLSPETQAAVVGIAAGTMDWAQDGELHEDYVIDVLNTDPKLRADLLKPAGHPTE